MLRQNQNFICKTHDIQPDMRGGHFIVVILTKYLYNLGNIATANDLSKVAGMSKLSKGTGM